MSLLFFRDKNRPSPHSRGRDTTSSQGVAPAKLALRGRQTAVGVDQPRGDGTRVPAVNHKRHQTEYEISHLAAPDTILDDTSGGDLTNKSFQAATLRRELSSDQAFGIA